MKNTFNSISSQGKRVTNEFLEFIDEKNFDDIMQSLSNNNIERAKHFLKERTYLQTSYPVRPIVGMLGEPLDVGFLVGDQGIDKDQYIPWSHTMFLR
mmetsp:Transcript_27402/g.20551  ORF Transcript_27402/g.20551 Transcript_27402/m.20551 type:complete len:97 (+) Transcript_27402:151-441(+)